MEREEEELLVSMYREIVNYLGGKNSLSIDYNFADVFFTNSNFLLQSELAKDGLFLVMLDRVIEDVEGASSTDLDEMEKVMFLARSLTIPSIVRETKVIRTNYFDYKYVYNFNDLRNKYGGLVNNINNVKKYKEEESNFSINRFNKILEFAYRSAYTHDHNLSLSIIIKENSEFLMNFYNSVRSNNNENFDIYVILLNLIKYPLRAIKFTNANITEVGNLSLSMDGSDFLNTNINFCFDNVIFDCDFLGILKKKGKKLLTDLKNMFKK